MIFIKKSVQAALLFIAFGCSTATISDQKTIPDNIAFGEPTQGGLNGQVVRVTTLNATGPGSFHEAIKTMGPRIVVFEVGGVIDLGKSFLEITEPFLTIAGQTAPSPGITIIKGSVSVRTHDVIIKHIRFRPGDAGEPRNSGWEPDGLETQGGDAYNIIIDHCSFTWAVDENLSASGPMSVGPDSTSRKITFSNNIIAEGLDSSSHHKTYPHSCGTLIHDFCQDIAIVGNLYAHNRQRSPFFKAHTTGIIVNNLIYNPGDLAIQLGYAESEWENSMYEPGNCQVSIVGNILYKGEDSHKELVLDPALGHIPANGDAFMLDNSAFDQNGQAIQLAMGDITILTEKPSWPGDFKELPSGEVVNYIIHHVGARPKDRDIIDKRIIQDFLDREGRIIDSQEEVGGYPDYKKRYRKLEISENYMEDWLAELAHEIE